MQQRDVRFDKLKIAAMLGIVWIHCVAHCNILEKVSYLSASYFLISIMYTIGFSMTNVFVIVSSYLLINRYKRRAGTIRFKKVYAMIALTMVYATLIYLALVAFNVIPFSWFDFLKSVFSVFVNQYWFVGAYLFLYIVSPLLFKALDSLSEKELRILCVIELLFFSIFPTAFIFESVIHFYDAQHGKSIIWMLVIFTLTFYIDKYGMTFIDRIKKSQVLIGMFATVLLLVFSRVVLRYISYLINLGGDGEGRLFFDESFLILIVSFGLFFLTLKERNRTARGKSSNLFANISNTTLGVYLVHNNPYLRGVLWSSVSPIVFAYPGVEIIMAVAVVWVVFTLCALLELIRISVSRKISGWKLRGRLYDGTSKS